MNRTTPTPENRRPKSRLIWLILGILGFGALMGWRGELESGWERALTAAAAAVVLVVAIEKYRG